MKKQGKRTDLTDDDVSGRSINILGQEENVSAKSIYRFVRLSYLCDSLLDIVDEGRISIKAGTELSYIEDIAAQDTLSKYLLEHSKTKITEEQAKRLRQLADENSLDAGAIASTLSPPKREKKALSKAVKIPVKRLREAFTNEEYADLDDDKLVEMLLDVFLNHKRSEVKNE